VLKDYEFLLPMIDISFRDILKVVLLDVIIDMYHLAYYEFDMEKFVE
jgi:hypothetical protein